MGAHDGSIIFEVGTDTSKLEKELDKTDRDIEKRERDIAKMQSKREKANKEGVFKAAELDAEKAKLEEMKRTLQEMRSVVKDKSFSLEVREETKAALPQAQSDVSDQSARVRLLQAEYNKTARAVEVYDRKLEEATTELDEQKEKAGGLIAQINSVSDATRKMAKAREAAEKSVNSWRLRLKEVTRSALVFTLISQGLGQLREWMGVVVTTNAEASASIARLKGALLTLAQPLMTAVLPAFIAFVNILTAIVGKVAQLLSILFGSTVKQSAKAAKSLNSQTKALKGVGGAAKSAGKSLAAFDEINKLSSDSSEPSGSAATSGTIEPDFSWSNGVSALLSEIAEDVLLIGAGLAMWKISGALPGVLGLIAQKMGGILIVAGGLLLTWDGLSDAWENGVNWTNMAAMIGGVTVAAIGLYKAFGRIPAGIALVLGGAALMVTGFQDMVKNGITLENMLLTIAGIIATGLGISFLVKSPIPLLIAAIGSILLAIVALTGNGGRLIDNLKQIFNGFVTFMRGVCSGDVKQILNGLKGMVKGALNLVLTTVGSFINAIIKGLNWMIGRINSIGLKIPEWVPEYGGKSIGFRLPTLKSVNIPRLATGAVIPPNREFLAVLGDQKSGTNIEAPLSTIQEAVATVMDDMFQGQMAGFEAVVSVLKEILEAIYGIEIGDEVIAKAAQRYRDKMAVVKGGV